MHLDPDYRVETLLRKEKLIRRRYAPMPVSDADPQPRAIMPDLQNPVTAMAAGSRRNAGRAEHSGHGRFVDMLRRNHPPTRRSLGREAHRLLVYLAAYCCRHRHPFGELALLLSVTVGGRARRGHA